jgi:hypothetical protein
MNYKLDIPTFNAADPATVVEVPPAAKLKLLRNGGTTLLRVHSERPADAPNQQKGWPLNADAATPTKGEALPQSVAAYNQMFVTSDGGAGVLYVMTES